MRSRLAVLMVADLVDYSRLMDADEAKAIAAVRSLKDTYLEPVVLSHGGEILKRMGDGWIVAFTSVTALVECATTVQTKLAGHPVIKLRIGAHIGEIVEDETDFYGAGVNLAQRLQTEAPPGGLMVSEDLHRQLTGELSDAFKDAGSFKLKNIANPVNAFQWRPTTGNAPGAGDVPTMVVETFEYAPENAETRAAAADLHDQLTLRLSRRTGIRILDDSTARSKESTYLLRGRLRVSGGRGRLTLALVLREAGQTLLSQTYEGDTADMFQFCDSLIERAEVDLRFQINAFDGDRIAHLPDEQLSVSELRSRAAQAFYRATVESWEYGRQLMDMALRLNPADAMALAMRGEAIVFLAAARHESLDDAGMQALEDDLNRAVEAAPRSDYVFFSRAYFRVYARRDVAAARKDIERALSLSPAYAPAYDALGLAHLLAGEYDDAVKALEKAVSFSEADTLLTHRLFFLAVALYCAGRPGEAIATIDRAIQLRPSQWNYHTLRALCCRAAGDEAAAEKSDALASQLPKEPSIHASRPTLPADKDELLRLLSPR